MGRTGIPHYSPCHRLNIISNSDPYATCAAAFRGTQPGSPGRQLAVGATRQYTSAPPAVGPFGYRGLQAGRWSCSSMYYSQGASGRIDPAGTTVTGREHMGAAQRIWLY
jgi:hypothetical protein